MTGGNYNANCKLLRDHYQSTKFEMHVLLDIHYLKLWFLGWLRDLSIQAFICRHSFNVFYNYIIEIFL